MELQMYADQRGPSLGTLNVSHYSCESVVLRGEVLRLGVDARETCPWQMWKGRTNLSPPVKGRFCPVGLVRKNGAFPQPTACLRENS